jgi:DNA gyrase/topoisomerase IV subunit A
MIINANGMIIKLLVKVVRITGRNAQGVHLVKVEDGERVRAVVPLAEKEEEDDGTNGNANSEE